MRLVWVLGVILVGACGSVTGIGRDGGGPDGAPIADGGVVDGPTADAALPGPVEVTVRRAGALAEGVAVLYSNPDGTPVARLLTDENGYTRADLDPQGMLSVLWTETDGSKRAAIFYGLYAGDHIAFAIPKEDAADPDIGNLDFNLGSETSQPGTATKYFYSDGCNDVELTAPNDIPFSNSVQARCITPADQMNVWVRATNASDVVVGHGTAVDLPRAGANWSGNVTWQPAGTPISVELTNAPAHNVGILVDGHVERGGVRYSIGGDSGPGGAGQGFAFDVAVPTGFAEAVILQVGVTWDLSSGPEGYSLVSRRFTGPMNPYQVDLSQALLARVNDLTLDQTNIARPTATWSSDAPLDGDAILIDIWQEEDGANEEHAYRLYLPPDHPASVKLPVFEEDVASWAPEIRPFEDPRLFVFDILGADGYRAVNFGNALGTGDQYRLQFVGDK